MSACEYYRQAVGLNPEHFRAYKLMGSALYALGDFAGCPAGSSPTMPMRTATWAALTARWCVLPPLPTAPALCGAALSAGCHCAGRQL